MHAALIIVLSTAVRLGLALPSSKDVLSARATAAHCPPVKSVHAGSLCDKVGELTMAMTGGDSSNDDFPYQHTQCTNEFECKEKCKSVGIENCKSFGFDRKGKNCTFYNGTISEQGFKHEASSTATFYDATCFKCRGCEPNLLNGNFESGSISPWGVDIYTRSAIVKGYKSKYAVSISPDSTGSSFDRYGGIWQFFRKCANATYNIDFYYMFPTAGDGSESLSVGVFEVNQVLGPQIWSVGTGGLSPGVWYNASTEWVSGPENGGLINIYAGKDQHPFSFVIDNIVISFAS